MPLSCMAASSMIVISNGSSCPIFSASASMVCGVTTLPGLFTRSRAKQTASAEISAACSSSSASGTVLSTVASHSGACFVSLLKRLKVYAPRYRPSTSACRFLLRASFSRMGAASTAFCALALCKARAAAPAALRKLFGLQSFPSPQPAKSSVSKPSPCGSTSVVTLPAS